MARPLKQIDGKQVELLASFGCSEREIGEIVGGSYKLLQRRFSDALEKGWAIRNIKLRRLQWQSAMSGDATMLIFLGKQYLGQKNNPEIVDHADTLGELLMEFRKRRKQLTDE